MAVQEILNSVSHLCVRFLKPNATQLSDLTSGFTGYRNDTSADQFAEYYCRYNDLKAVQAYHTSVRGWLFFISGIIGLVGYIFAAITLSVKQFSSPSFTYHKAITGAEFVHMFVMTTLGAKDALPQYNYFWQSYTFSAYSSYGGWKIGDSMKLMTSVIVTLMSLERALALVAPTFFKRINNQKIALCAIVISFPIGCMNLADSFAQYIVLDGTAYVGIPTYFGLNYAAYFQEARNAIAIATGVFTVLFSGTVSVRLVMLIRLHQKQFVKSSTALRQEWTTTKQICRLQLIIAVSTLMDQAIYTPWKVMADNERIRPVTIGGKALVQLPWSVAIFQLWQSELATTLRLMQGITGVLNHCGHFYWYLLFHRRFRQGFLEIVARIRPPFKVNLI